MSLINNDRDMKKLLDDLRVGEFSATDLKHIALTLPVHVLAAALYANSSNDSFSRADTHDRKADIIARLLHCWLLAPEQRLGQLIINACGVKRDLFFVEDDYLARLAEAFVQGDLAPTE
jgi:hypothetical protein